MTTLEYKEGETEQERQEKNGLLVEREVLLLFSYPMQTLLDKEIISYFDIENLYTENGNGEEEPKEIFEYWVVTEWLYEKLKEIGQPVVEWENLHIWGRCCTGQAILLDNTMTEVRKLLTKQL